ncbi:MAG: FGGY family carbohydrate kinase [Acidimicrobiales bacterium]
MDLLLALDAGTSGVRTVAFDRAATVVDSAYRELTQHFPSPGEVEHDPGEIARLAAVTLGEVAARARERGDRVVCLGLTNQRETTVAFDRADGAVRHRALVWQDRRTADACAALAAAGHEPLVRATTGLVLDPYFSATKMRWLIEHGTLDGARAPALATVDTWLLWWLTGGPEGGAYLTEPSNAARTSLLDLATLGWSPAMTELFGVPATTLARVAPSCGAFGAVTAHAVPALAGVPITGVLGDQQAALFGQACVEPGAVKATYGTGAFVLAHAGASVPAVVEGLVTTVAWDLGDLGPVAYALEGSAFVAGAAVLWLRDVLGFVARADELEELALSVAGSDGVTFVPAFTGLGSPFWRAEARGALAGLSRGVGRAHVARALVEALAYQVRAMTDAFATTTAAPTELRADGGAAQMDLLLQLQATNSRLPVLRGRTLEATARGAATVAGLGAGVYASLEEVAALWECERRFEPGDPSAVDAGYLAWLAAVARA